MNYRHIYHAGNFADVIKHAVLALVLSHLGRKDTPFFTLDTHAGCGVYDLWSAESEKTGEFKAGIARVLEAPDPPPSLLPYLRAVRALNEGVENDGKVLRWYPGSPALVRALLRPQDRLAAIELHPEDAATLQSVFAHERRAKVHQMDGYAAMKAMLPPPERRGLVLIDPPFEVKDELERLRRALRQAMKRWPTGTYAVWYPIKGREPIRRFLDDLVADGLPKALVAELIMRPGDDPFRLNGCGLLLVNPPWQLDEALAELLPWLAQVLAPGQGRHRLAWLVGEA